MSDSSPHEDAADVFAERARAKYGDSIAHLVVFGSTARGETRGVDSDVDVFIVISDPTIERPLRDLAYDVGLEYGLVFSVHTLTAERFDARKDHPFVRTVFEEGRSYA
ncbi:nucleotidyltransferase domain-containing protein [Halobacteria archaeon AArc-m2/3/4]|uniref:Nucleotidyltransferase domain-containing protein n=1 Tax=Natronoglomus mannanivorans TaxID=2979990 RepID=A0AAP2Z3I5_9EURY|nr:nucleotidyltransferase domain-containing protein [Halobacteria archaeon AArc-xg1-1]MCU4974316.1 nucleotidyltransferase domain-containing protein [Halobacteria archaeon AArc-m2/3/4]